jgi:hypothetical protein
MAPLYIPRKTQLTESPLPAMILAFLPLLVASGDAGVFNVFTTFKPHCPYNIHVCSPKGPPGHTGLCIRLPGVPVTTLPTEIIYSTRVVPKQQVGLHAGKDSSKHMQIVLWMLCPTSIIIISFVWSMHAACDSEQALPGGTDCSWKVTFGQPTCLA